MTSDEKQDLRRKLNRFNSLPEEERKRMRALATAVEQQPDAVQLRQVLVRYDDWLTQLSSTERHQLLILAGASRLEKIKAMRGEVLSPADRDAFGDWLERGILKNLPLQERSRIEALPGPGRQAEVMRHLWMSRRRGKLPDNLDFDELRGSLSDLAQQRLDFAIEPGEKRHLFDSWSFQVFRSRDRGHGERRQWPEVSDETLARYFEEELSESMRADLMSRPAEEMKFHLRMQYNLDHPENVDERQSDGDAGQTESAEKPADTPATKTRRDRERRPRQAPSS